MLQRLHNGDAIRWEAGERLQDIFEGSVDRLITEGKGDRAAISTPTGDISYLELETRSNQLAHYLRESGIKPGDRIALLFDRSPETYMALLAVSKAGGVYVPLDASYPAERLSFILEDAEVGTILSVSAFADTLRELDVPAILLDECEADIGAQSGERVKEPGPSPEDELCYIVYTSGSTGKPKGVAVDHSSIVNFIRVAGEVYGVEGTDRVYQGLTTAFDFSVEEIWIAFNTGATLVPAPPGPSLAGADLAAFLKENGVTAFCCVPTLLATLEDDLPELRFLLVSGEACPEDLIARWHREGRRILNAYGPTEATVTATWLELHPGRPVTIGKPLPTYSVLILDPEKGEALPNGSTGEIGIAGIGLARGYLNRDDLTQEKFIPDFAGVPNNPSGRIYRTGDLGRINDEGEIEYLGRIDTQVKIRGYRIELTEIESVLLQIPGIGQAAVVSHQPKGGQKELVAYYCPRPGKDPLTPADIVSFLRDRLPSYMVPAYFEELTEIPLTPSNKADHKKLPAPKSKRLTVQAKDPVRAADACEEALSESLAETLGLEQVSVVDDFFLDLGAHSLLMAQFAAQIRQKEIAPDISMRDIYLNPTVRQLGKHIESSSTLAIAVRHKAAETVHRAKTRDYYLCGTLQLFSYALYAAITVTWLTAGLDWAHLENGIAGPYVRVIAFSLATFLLFSATPILLKWLLVGRWREETIPVWSLRYFRFWLVKQLVQVNPMALFAGTEFYNIYLRLLGAKIGRGAVIYSRGVPVCSDLVSIGDGTILQKESVLLGYHALAGKIRTGPVTLGANVVVGEGSVLDIHTAMGDDSQLGHRSALLPGQTVPEAQSFHGSPAEETDTDFRTVEPAGCSPARRLFYPSMLLLNNLLLYLPATIVASFELFDASPKAGNVMFLDLLLLSLLGYFGMLVLGLAFITSVPALLNRFLLPEKIYPLYGLHYLLFRYIQFATNSRVYSILFGDSSWVVNYLRWIGYELNEVRQTGTNFGTFNLHENPFLCDVGSGTMVSDGLSMMNAHFSNTSFRLSKCTIGPSNYLGNDVIMPPDAKTGANCLLATKVMVPIDGPVRENTGLLGSPPFEIPRATNRDTRLGAITEDKRAQLLKKKNAANLLTIATHLFFRWLYYFLACLAAYYTWMLYKSDGVLALVAATLGFTVFTIAYLVLVERLSLGFKLLEPVTCSIYDPRFWRVEHYWKVSESYLRGMFKGTPLKNVVSRLLGMKVGRMVFDDGAQATERTMVEIGDHATLNEGTTLQSHSLEEGVFKSDHIRLGAGCTIGTKAYIHYGTEIGETAVIGADAFLMKGERPAPGSAWCGNPAHSTR